MAVSQAGTRGRIRAIAPVVTILLLAFMLPASHANYLDDVGFTDLQNELGSSMPTGAGIEVSQIEATSGGYYLPDTTLSQFSGKTFTDKSNVATGISSHATNVGTFFYGRTNSLAPDIPAIDNYEANNWIGSGFLNHGSFPSQPPRVETRRIQNCSWISLSTDTNALTDITRRLDYAINRDGYTATVSVNNGDSTDNIPGLLAHSYNAISVGRSDGLHSHGSTFYDVSGRIKPDIVAPMTATSWAAPIVGSAAALLLETADNDSALANGAEPESVKAILLAGATKEEFPDWDRTHTRPLDDVYGAGELNIQNSYHILDRGEQTPSSSSNAAETGWDFNSIGTSDVTYFIDIPADGPKAELTAALTWNRIIEDGLPGPSWGDPDAVVWDLRLELYEASDFTLGLQLDYSDSPVDNVEYVYVTNLDPGQYALKVVTDSGQSGDIDYALAWRTESVPEPASLGLIGLAGLLLARRRRRG